MIKENIDYSKKMAKEKMNKRREAAEDILNFFSKIASFEADQEIKQERQDEVEVPDVLLESKKILESFSNIDFETFRSIIDSINARANQVPVDRDKQTPENRMTYTNQAGEIDEVFLSVDQSEEIWKKTFEDLIKNKIKQQEEISEDTAESVALTLFNLVNFTHLYRNGNGRTARSLYYLLSPNIEKGREDFEKDFTKIMTKEDDNGGTRALVHLLRGEVYQTMLLERGLDPSLDKENLGHYSQINAGSFSFEEEKIKFLALYDVVEEGSNDYDLSDIMDKRSNTPKKEEMIKEIKPFVKDENFAETEDLSGYIVSANSWEAIKNNEDYKELKDQVEEKAEETRREYVEKIIDISMDDDLPETEFGEKIYNNIERIFN